MRILVFTGFLLLLVHPANGQMPNLKAGINYSTLSAPDSFYKFHFGYYAGIGSSKLIGVNSSLKYELVYSLLVAKASDGMGTIRFRHSYLNMPLLYSINLGRVYIEAGPQVGLILNATLKTDSDREIVTSKVSVLDVAAVGGVGILLSKTIRIESRLIYSLNPTNSERTSAGDYRLLVVQTGLVFNFTSKVE